MRPPTDGPTMTVSPGRTYRSPDAENSSSGTSSVAALTGWPDSS